MDHIGNLNMCIEYREKKTHAISMLNTWPRRRSFLWKISSRSSKLRLRRRYHSMLIIDGNDSSFGLCGGNIRGILGENPPNGAPKLPSPRRHGRLWKKGTKHHFFPNEAWALLLGGFLPLDCHEKKNSLKASVAQRWPSTKASHFVGPKSLRSIQFTKKVKPNLC